MMRNEAVNELRYTLETARYEPPEFTEQAKCAECVGKDRVDEPLSPEAANGANSSRFNVITNRRHHCRRCSRSLCDRHCRARRVIELFGYVEPVRVCDCCAEHLDWGSELSKDMRQKEMSTEAPWAQNSWVDKAVAYGHPAHVVEGPVERIMKMQDNIVRLEKTIEHTIARQVECEAVLELKVRAGAELQAGLDRAQQALNDCEMAEAERASEEMEAEGAEDMLPFEALRDENPRNAASVGRKRQPLKSKGGKDGERLALGALTPNSATPKRKVKASPSKPKAMAKFGKKRDSSGAEMSSCSSPNFSESASSSQGGVSPICVSWYRDSARECAFPEWIELAIAMGYDRDITNSAVQELLSKSSKFHTFDAFVDTLDRKGAMAPDMKAAPEASQSRSRGSEDLRSKMKEFERLQCQGEHEGIVQNAADIPEDQLLCNICMNNKVGVMFKCGHLKCEDCANKLFSDSNPLCPDCRTRLTSPRKFFLP